jgi:F-type H+/Na+-transporting ATPase subunit beta
MSKVIGKVAQIIGPVVDVVFNGKDVELPKIYDSLEITKKDGTILVKTLFVPFLWIQLTD